MKKTRLLPIVAAALAGAALVLAPMDTAVAADRPVTIQNFSFGSSLSVAVGDRVVWTNSDTVPHTASSDPGVAPAFDTGNIAPGATGSVTFATAGTYTYFCKIHASMKGTVVVTAAQAPAATTAAGGASPQAPAAGGGLAEADGGLSPLWFAAGGAAVLVTAGAGALAVRRRP